MMMMGLGPCLGMTSGTEDEVECKPNDELSAEYAERSRSFAPVLRATLVMDTARKNKLYKEGEKYYCGELFRFYTAIHEWESLYKTDPKRARLMASKLVSTFVESGARYENGCLSSQTRVDLMKGKNGGKIDARFFQAAKDEVARDITMNARLRSIVEHAVYGSGERHSREITPS